MTTKDKEKFDANQLKFYEKYGYIQGIREALKHMPTGKESARLETLISGIKAEIEQIQQENERLLGLNGSNE